MTTASKESIHAALAEIRAEYMLELPGRIAALAAAVQRAKSGEGAVSDVSALAHTLCGTSGSYGFIALSEAARRIEDLATADPAWVEIDAAVSDLEAAFARIRSRRR